MNILGVDPGPTESAYLLLRDGVPVEYGIIPNWSLACNLKRRTFPCSAPDVLVVEWVSFYGNDIHAGSSTFETCYWVGRFVDSWGDDETAYRIERRKVRTELCGTAKAGDKEVRAVLIDRYGGKEKAIGRKATKGPLYGIASHVWSALAVSIVHADRFANGHDKCDNERVEPPQERRSDP